MAPQSTAHRIEQKSSPTVWESLIWYLTPVWPLQLLASFWACVLLSDIQKTFLHIYDVEASWRKGKRHCVLCLSQPRVEAVNTERPQQDEVAASSNGVGSQWTGEECPMPAFFLFWATTFLVTPLGLWSLLFSFALLFALHLVYGLSSSQLLSHLLWGGQSTCLSSTAVKNNTSTSGKDAQHPSHLVSLD